MSKLEVIATSTFGLEAVVKREVESLGYPILSSENGKVTYMTDERGVVCSNLWLRCADRVLIKLAEFHAKTFEELFQQVKAIAWEQWFTFDSRIVVTGTSVKSQLHSVPGCQSIGKKAIIERLAETYAVSEFPETGAEFVVKLTLLKDRVTVTLDTSGAGLHKRGYRVKNVPAPIKETLAAGLLYLSVWRKDKPLTDPFCGSGTIAIEAALMARNIAPGVSRNFAAESWECIPKKLWKEERRRAFDAIDYDTELNILGTDIDKRAIFAARENAIEAGVEDSIKFKVMNAQSVELRGSYGVLVTNPPYGERIGDKAKLGKLYDMLAKKQQANPTWSIYVITADKSFEETFGNAARRRKLFNGMIETCYYQNPGIKPVKKVK